MLPDDWRYDPRLTAEVDHTVAERTARGQSARQIAEHLGVAERTVSRIRARQAKGIERTPARPPVVMGPRCGAVTIIPTTRRNSELRCWKSALCQRQLNHEGQHRALRGTLPFDTDLREVAR